MKLVVDFLPPSFAASYFFIVVETTILSRR